MPDQRLLTSSPTISRIRPVRTPFPVRLFLLFPCLAGKTKCSNEKNANLLHQRQYRFENRVPTAFSTTSPSQGEFRADSAVRAPASMAIAALLDARAGGATVPAASCARGGDQIAGYWKARR